MDDLKKVEKKCAKKFHQYLIDNPLESVYEEEKGVEVEAYYFSED